MGTYILCASYIMVYALIPMPLFQAMPMLSESGKQQAPTEGRQPELKLSTVASKQHTYQQTLSQQPEVLVSKIHKENPRPLTPEKFTLTDNKQPNVSKQTKQEISQDDRNIKILPPTGKNNTEVLENLESLKLMKSGRGPQMANSGQFRPRDTKINKLINGSLKQAKRGRKYLYKVDPTTFARWHVGNKSAIFERSLLNTTRKDCSLGFVRKGDRCYSYFDVLTTNDDCVSLCSIFLGTIVLPTSDATKDYIHGQMINSLTTQNLTKIYPYWLGMVYTTRANGWRILGSSPVQVNYFNWAAGEPNTPAPNDCAAVGTSDAYWRVYKCDNYGYCACDSGLHDLQNVTPNG
ncbi:uncharacterized protein LOC131935602 [Physella acuta]|uniref:uncharacterized protein LOC131935602 n=1 Tax=Physella acuta TaxID=109671 RepID=UPI0027DAEDCE|nr:uncharacterized protein LOC131935602 [Physella acuta]